MDQQDEHEYVVPLLDQRYFGAGIRRDRVKFVSASDGSAGQAAALEHTSDGLTPGQRYLNIVLSGSGEAGGKVSFRSPASVESGPETTVESTPSPHGTPPTCEKCNLPILESSRAAHAGSLAHQVSLSHVHPPSALDRTRRGLTILQSSGWDPDSRLGLGPAGRGRLFPIRAEQNAEKTGLGFVESSTADVRRVDKVRKLDAGQMRKLHASQKKRAERLNRLFYAEDDVTKYLGEEV